MTFFLFLFEGKHCNLARYLYPLTSTVFQDYGNIYQKQELSTVLKWGPLLNTKSNKKGIQNKSEVPLWFEAMMFTKEIASLMKPACSKLFHIETKNLMIGVWIEKGLPPTVLFIYAFYLGHCLKVLGFLIIDLFISNVRSMLNGFYDTFWIIVILKI